MSRQTSENRSEAEAQLGEPKLVCRINRTALFWGFLLASLPCAFGVAVLVLVVRRLLADWSGDVFEAIVFLPVGVGAFWGGAVLLRKVNRQRHVRAVVHANGLSYHRDGVCLTCRWDEIQQVWWGAENQYEDLQIKVTGFVPVPGKIRMRIHTDHQVIVRRKDGVQLVFTNELQNVVKLARAIQEVKKGSGAILRTNRYT